MRNACAEATIAGSGRIAAGLVPGAPEGDLVLAATPAAALEPAASLDPETTGLELATTLDLTVDLALPADLVLPATGPASAGFFVGTVVASALPLRGRSGAR